MLIAEDLLLLSVDDETGKTAGVDNLGVRLAGALMADLAAANRTLVKGGPEAGATKEERKQALDAYVRVTNNDPTGHPALDAALQAVLATEGKAQAVVEAISKDAEENLLAGLAERGILEKKESKLFAMLPITRWPAADSAHETALRATLRSVLVDGAEPDERTATLISLLHGSGLIGGLVGKENRKAAEDRAEEIAGSEYGFATVATQVAIAATVATVAVVGAGVAAALILAASKDAEAAAAPAEPAPTA
ncbi:GOLPH3/VPS74 family protein [Antribacter gilvus]|uniref:GOLPH3/VPS74 family protein n=1 Tax=Antribacter gilvus TaxID=2304675 RepID=UPI000F7B6311|nr:GPP34 family phosphoprotein [Antribacter gilvus]